MVLFSPLGDRVLAKPMKYASLARLTLSLVLGDRVLAKPMKYASLARLTLSLVLGDRVLAKPMKYASLARLTLSKMFALALFSPDWTPLSGYNGSTPPGVKYMDIVKVTGKTMLALIFTKIPK